MSDGNAAQTCELCGAEVETFKRFGALVLRSYSAVCRSCIQEHFAPCTIIVDPSKAGQISHSDWLPSGWTP